jgi:hypothetical protein
MLRTWWLDVSTGLLHTDQMCGGMRCGPDGVICHQIEPPSGISECDYSVCDMCSVICPICQECVYVKDSVRAECTHAVHVDCYLELYGKAKIDGKEGDVFCPCCRKQMEFKAGTFDALMNLWESQQNEVVRRFSVDGGEQQIVLISDDEFEPSYSP